MITHERRLEIEKQIKKNNNEAWDLRRQNEQLEKELYEGKHDHNPKLDEHGFVLCPYCEQRAFGGYGFSRGGGVNFHCENKHTWYLDVNDDNGLSEFKFECEYPSIKSPGYLFYADDRQGIRTVNAEELLQLGEDYESIRSR